MIGIGGTENLLGMIRRLIGPIAGFMGDFGSDVEVHIAGRLEGSLRTGRDLVIEEKARIKADIAAHNVSVAGVIRGSITANQVEVLGTGSVWGNISANYFVVNEGGFIRGQIEQKQIHEASTSCETPGDLLAALEGAATTWSRHQVREAPTPAPLSRNRVWRGPPNSRG